MEQAGWGCRLHYRSYRPVLLSQHREPNHFHYFRFKSLLTGIVGYVIDCPACFACPPMFTPSAAPHRRVCTTRNSVMRALLARLVMTARCHHNCCAAPTTRSPDCRPGFGQQDCSPASYLQFIVQCAIYVAGHSLVCSLLAVEGNEFLYIWHK